MNVKVKAFTKDFYERIILDLDERQVWQSDVKVKDSIDGIRIYPSDFPEAEFFAIVVERD